MSSMTESEFNELEDQLTTEDDIVGDSTAFFEVGDLGYFAVFYKNDSEDELPPRSFVIDLASLTTEVEKRGLSEDCVNGILEGLSTACQMVFTNYNLTPRVTKPKFAVGQHLCKEEYAAIMEHAANNTPEEDEIMS